MSLLRFTHIVSGTILYDGVDITKVPRRRLRQALTIIPQEAVLFNGTIDSNLDPTGKIPKEHLQNAIDSCQGIASFQFHRDSEGRNGQDGHSHEDTGSSSTVTEEDAVPQANGKAPTGTGLTLSTKVNQKGENFSHGQRQVLSLCRALVRKSRVMLLDEATASMDYETDRGIQEVLRRELEATDGDRTLVTIAHRLRTIIDYDTIVVMANGKTAE